jgi:hypothetical protein
MTQRKIQIRVASMVPLVAIVVVLTGLNKIPRSTAQDNTSSAQQEKPFDQSQKLADLMKQIDERH